MPSGMGRTVLWGVLWCFTATTLWTLPGGSGAWAQAQTFRQETASAADVDAGQTPPALPDESTDAAKASPNSTQTSIDEPEGESAGGQAVSGVEKSEIEKSSSDQGRKPKPESELGKQTDSQPKQAPKKQSNTNPSRKKAKKGKDVEDEGNFVDRLLTVGPTKKKDRFNLDYEPSDEPIIQKDDSKPATPFYKHWLFWTVIGVAACTGTVLFVKYGVDHRDSMSLEVSQR